MRVPACALVALLCCGCFAFEEIEAGQELMDSHSPKSAEPEPEPEAPLYTAAARPEPGWSERLQEWWRDVREEAPTPPDPNDALVRCALRERPARSSSCR